MFNFTQEQLQFYIYFCLVFTLYNRLHNFTHYDAVPTAILHKS